MTATGAWPKPSIPYPPESCTTAPCVVTIHGPDAASGTYGLMLGAG